LAHAAELVIEVAIELVIEVVQLAGAPVQSSAAAVAGIYLD
jgi:hypothetical protein